ncbi:unnamed protein product [Microthlaspi erraticum]|uniref:Methyltransferase n=1 Tax=Microthlaspi erraticum TaxID=1685480 RepID=A0A6D2HS19_9BRAS|nr:unnamed protein product [Microthlaspi erraticum]
MSNSDAFRLVPGLGGETNVLTAVEKYERYHVLHDGEADPRKVNYTDMVNKYYDLASQFYEYGWGDCLHFAHRWKGESLRESLKRYEHFIAMQLAMKQGDKVLDVGCGIGGPMREIARFSNVSITGVNNNEYQVARCKKLNQLAGVDETCNIVQADFMNMPFPDNSFDEVYAIEATCHAPDAYGCYKEMYRVLKPGQKFAIYEWCLTEAFDPNNYEHQKVKEEIEFGNALPGLRITTQVLEAVKRAGFDVIWDNDFATDSPVPWYLPMDTNKLSFLSFRVTTVGKFLTDNLLKALEYVRVVPAGTQKVQAILQKAANGLVDGGRKGIFTPMYFVLARKPE